ncbi:MAG: hypothetical protein HRU19_25460, partial [Pseudobacteriovorax sp.]|nr:hypothetical protein [Pseudobacteriovorax sp.]
LFSQIYKILPYTLTYAECAFRGSNTFEKNLNETESFWLSYDLAISKSYVLRWRNDFLTASLLLVELLEKVQDRGDPEVEAKIHLDLGIVYNELGLVEKAAEHGFLALNIFESLENYEEQVKILNNLAISKRQNGSNSDSLSLFRRAVALLDKSISIESQALTLANLALVEIDSGEMGPAQKSIAKLDDIAGNYGNAIFLIYSDILKIKIKNAQNNFQEAAALNAQLDKYEEKSFIPQFKIWRSVDYARALRGLKKYDQAKIAIDDGMKQAKHSGIKRELADAIYEYYLLSRDQGDYAKALESYIEYVETKEEIESEINRNKVLALEASYQKERQVRQEKQLAMLEQSNDMQRDQIVFQNKLEKIYLTAGCLFLVIAYAFFKLFRKASRLKEQVNEFYKSEKRLNRHFVGQLEKVFYPHQITRIQGGDILENTMPTHKGKAIVLAFDMVNSTRISLANSHDVIEAGMKAALSHLATSYNEESLTAKGYRIKEMGDGFLVSIGYPFDLAEGCDLWETAVTLAEDMINSFYYEMNLLNLPHPVHCCIGVAYGDIHGRYPKSGTVEYDLFGKAIVLATRYEQMRKVMFTAMEFSCLIVQDLIIEQLPESMQNEFTKFSLDGHRHTVRDHKEAQHLYYKKVDEEKEAQVS